MSSEQVTRKNGKSAFAATERGDNTSSYLKCTQKKQRWLALSLFLMLTLLYLPSLRNQFIYDDNELIIEEVRPRGLADFGRVFTTRHFSTVPYYRPIVRLTYRLQKYAHDLTPWPYHLANSLLGALAGVAAFRLLSNPFFKIRRSVAGAVALMWAAHPAFSSCVHQIVAGRETLLPSIFILLSVDSWCRSGGAWSRRTLGWFMLALFSKEQAIVLPVLLAFYELFNVTGELGIQRPFRWLRRYMMPFFAIIGYLALRWHLFSGSEFEINYDYPLLPMYSYLYALQTLFFPFVDLAYEPPMLVWWSTWRALGSIMLTLVLTVVCMLRGLRRQVLFWGAWFFIIQAPTANILKQEAPFAERYMILAALALFAMAASLYCSYVVIGKVQRHILIAFLLALTLFWSGISLHRGRFFYDDPTFISQWIRTNPWNVDALVNHAKYKIDEEDFETALWAASRAVQQAPEMEGAWYNYGLANYHLGQLEKAVVAFHRALELDPDHEARYNLALSLSDLGHTELAIDTYLAAIERKPEHGDSLYNLALLLARQGDYEAATQYFERAAEVKPDDAEAVYNQGVALEQLQRMDEAMACYQEAIARDSEHTSALYNLATLYFRQRDFESAIRYYSRVLEIDPADLQARQNLNAARAALRGRTDP